MGCGYSGFPELSAEKFIVSIPPLRDVQNSEYLNLFCELVVCLHIGQYSVFGWTCSFLWLVPMERVGNHQCWEGKCKAEGDKERSRCCLGTSRAKSDTMSPRYPARIRSLELLLSLCSGVILRKLSTCWSLHTTFAQVRAKELLWLFFVGFQWRSVSPVPLLNLFSE